MNRRDQEKEQRRKKREEDILKASEALFLSKGINNAKMTDIAKACELGKGTLYFYFKSKDEIVWQLLMKHSLEEYNAGIEYVENAGGSGFEKLERYLTLFADELIESFDVSNPSFLYRDYIKSLLSENKLSEEMKVEFKSIFNRNLSSVIKLIEEGVADGSVKTAMNPKAIGGAVGTAFGTYFSYVISLKASFDDDFIEEVKENYRVFTALLLSSIRNQEE